MNELINLLVEGTGRAAVLHAREKNVDFDTDKMVAAIKVVMKRNVADILDTLKNATEANMGDAMYKHILNVECNSMAVEALKECGAI